MPSNRFLWASFLGARSGSPAGIKHGRVHVRIPSIHTHSYRMVHVIPEFAQHTSCVEMASGVCLFAHAVSKRANKNCKHTNLLSTCLLVFEYFINMSS